MTLSAVGHQCFRPQMTTREFGFSTCKKVSVWSRHSYRCTLGSKVSRCARRTKRHRRFSINATDTGGLSRGDVYGTAIAALTRMDEPRSLANNPADFNAAMVDRGSVR